MATPFRLNLTPCLLAAVLSAAAGWIWASGAGASSPLGTSSAPAAGTAGLAGARPRSQPPEEFRFGDALTLADLVRRSDLIVAGEVVDLRSSWNADRTDIFTTVILRVDHPLKGRTSRDVRFRVRGGTVGDDWVFVTHAPRFEFGERALVFLRSGGGRLPTVVGMEAGKRRLVGDRAGAERILPELQWNGGGVGPPLALATVEELAAALPRVEALGRGRQD